MHKAKRDQKKSLIYGLGGAPLGGAAGFGLAKFVCSEQDRKCIKRLTKYGALGGGAGGLLIQKYAFMAHSREDEMEADRIRFRTSVRAGFDSEHVEDFYGRLLLLEKKYQRSQDSINKAFVDAMSTRPPGEDRVRQLNEMAKQFPQKGILETREYRKLKKMI